MRQFCLFLLCPLFAATGFTQSTRPYFSVGTVAPTGYYRAPALQAALGVSFSNQLSLATYLELQAFDADHPAQIGGQLQYSTHGSGSKGWVFRLGIGGGWDRTGEDNPQFAATYKSLHVDWGIGRHLSPRWMISIGGRRVGDWKTGYSPYPATYSSRLVTRLDFQLLKPQTATETSTLSTLPPIYLLLATGNNIPTQAFPDLNRTAAIALGWRLNAQWGIGISTSRSTARGIEQVSNRDYFRGWGVHTLFTHRRAIALVEIGGVQNVEKGSVDWMYGATDLFTQHPQTTRLYGKVMMGWRLFGPVYLQASAKIAPWLRGPYRKSVVDYSTYAIQEIASEPDARFNYNEISAGFVLLLENVSRRTGVETEHW